MMAQVKRIYFLFSSHYFLKELENMVSFFLSSYKNPHEGLGELEKAVEHSAVGLCSHGISCSPKLSLVFLFNN